MFFSSSMTRPKARTRSRTRSPMQRVARYLSEEGGDGEGGGAGGGGSLSPLTVDEECFVRAVADLVALCVEPAHRPLGRSARRSTVPPS